MTYPIYIYPTRQPVQIWAYNGCLYVVSAKGTSCVCQPQCTPAGCVVPDKVKENALQV